MCPAECKTGLARTVSTSLLKGSNKMNRYRKGRTTASKKSKSNRQQRWGGGGVGLACCLGFVVLVCSWRRLQADRHSLPFPSLSLNEGPPSRCCGPPPQRGGGGGRLFFTSI